MKAAEFGLVRVVNGNSYWFEYIPGTAHLRPYWRTKRAGKVLTASGDHKLVWAIMDADRTAAAALRSEIKGLVKSLTSPIDRSGTDT